MAGRKRHTPEQVIRKLHHGDELAATGADVEEIARQLDVSVPTLYNWRKQYGGMKADDAKEFNERGGRKRPTREAPRRSRTREGCAQGDREGKF